MAITPIQKFYDINTNPVTRKNYEFQLKKFWKWGKLDSDDFVKLDKSEREDKVKQYIQFLKMKTEKWGTPAPSSYAPIIASIESFCFANELEMNWKLIKRGKPKITKLTNQYPYLEKDIEKMLSVADNLRDVAFIHMMASTAPRIGEVNDINIKDVIPIEDGAILVMYAEQLAEYKVPMTPEAYNAIRNYLECREDTSPNAPLFATLGKAEKRMKADSVKEFMKRFRNKIENLKKDGKRKDKAPNNAFRKRLQIIYSNARIDPRYADYFLNHNLGQQDGHYFRKMPNEDLWLAFKPAISFITIDKSLKIESQKNEEIKIIKEEHDGALKEKVEKQDELMQRMMMSLATTKYMLYEKMYSECFGGKNPDLEKLSKRMSNEEIADWNSIIEIVQREKDWSVKTGSNSDKFLRDSKEEKEIQALIKKIEKLE